MQTTGSTVASVPRSHDADGSPRAEGPPNSPRNIRSRSRMRKHYMASVRAMKRRFSTALS